MKISNHHNWPFFGKCGLFTLSSKYNYYRLTVSRADLHCRSITGRAGYSFPIRNPRKGIAMSLFPKVIVRPILIAMVLALTPAAAYAAAFIKFDGIEAEMPVTDATTVQEVAVFVARHTGVDVDRISLSWRGKELNGGRRTLGSYGVPAIGGRRHDVLNYEEIKVTYKIKNSGAGSEKPLK
jgi:hypothetical protein